MPWCTFTLPRKGNLDEVVQQSRRLIPRPPFGRISNHGEISDVYYQAGGLLQVLNQ
jgi:hypothetical protein